jgi:hypothetical protein
MARQKRYHYYICTTKQKRGTGSCPARALPADTIENFVVDQIRALGHDPAAWHDHLIGDQGDIASILTELQAESAHLDKDLTCWKEEMRRLARRLAQGKNNEDEISRLADLQDRIQAGDERATELAERSASLRQQHVHPEELVSVLSLLNGSWETTPRLEQARILHHLLKRIEHDGSQISLSFDRAGIKQLAAQGARTSKETE